MKRFSAALFGLLLTTAAHAQSGLLPANQVWAGPPSGGQGFARARALVSADLPAVPAGSLSLASGQIFVGQVSGFAGAVALSGDCTIVASGAITCTKTNGAAFTALATTVPGTGVATALGTAVGSAGAFVVNGGALGTPSSATLTNATGLPVGTGVSGLGTGVATALGVAIGSAGAPVVNGGALGTPSSGVGTNLTALNASNLSSGTVAAARGGAGTITGALKGSGAGVVTQAACADLSNAAASCSTDATNATNLASGTVPFARLPTFARSQTLPGNPAGTTSASAVMMGLAGAVTPAQSGNVLFQVRFDMQNSTANDGCVAQIMRGTGTAPVNGAASVGTAVGNPVQLSENANTAGLLVPASAIGYATGMATGTAAWYDLSLRAVTGGTCAVFNVTMVAIEE